MSQKPLSSIRSIRSAQDEYPSPSTGSSFAPILQVVKKQQRSAAATAPVPGWPQKKVSRWWSASCLKLALSGLDFWFLATYHLNMLEGRPVSCTLHPSLLRHGRSCSPLGPELCRSEERVAGCKTKPSEQSNPKRHRLRAENTPKLNQVLDDEPRFRDTETTHCLSILAEAWRALPRKALNLYTRNPNVKQRTFNPYRSGSGPLRSETLTGVHLRHDHLYPAFA